MSSDALTALLLTLEIALAATAIVLVPGILLGLVLARRDFRGKSVAETIISLPLVLPPTAVGYILLRLLARDGLFGVRALGFDLDLLFTWKGAAIASAVMALPLVARTARVAFETVPARLELMARTLGHGRLGALRTVTLPLASRGLLAAAIMGFSRAVGEFGATIIVAGNIPGKTQTLSLAIFSSIQAGRDQEATALLVVTVLVAFTAIFCVERLMRGGAPLR